MISESWVCGSMRYDKLFFFFFTGILHRKNYNDQVKTMPSDI